MTLQQLLEQLILLGYVFKFIDPLTSGPITPDESRQLWQLAHAHAAPMIEAYRRLNLAADPLGTVAPAPPTQAWPQPAFSAPWSPSPAAPTPGPGYKIEPAQIFPAPLAGGLSATQLAPPSAPPLTLVSPVAGHSNGNGTHEVAQILEAAPAALKPAIEAEMKRREKEAKRQESFLADLKKQMEGEAPKA
jgi:hypothetical protein